MHLFQKSFLASHEGKSINLLWEEFKGALHSGIMKHVPQHTISTKPSLPWMTQEIKLTIQKRDSLYDKYKGLRRPTDRCAFLEAKQLVKQKLKQAHDRYIEEILGLTNSLEQPEPNCQSSPEPHKSTLAPKKLFSLLKNSKQDSKGIAPLKKDGKLYSNTVVEANVLNQQFQSVFTPKCSLKLSQLASMAVQDLSDSGTIDPSQIPGECLNTTHGKYHCLNKWHCQILEGPKSP